jgi:hypothetical protein
MGSFPAPSFEIGLLGSRLWVQEAERLFQQKGVPTRLLTGIFPETGAHVWQADRMGLEEGWRQVAVAGTGEGQCPLVIFPGDSPWADRPDWVRMATARFRLLSPPASALDLVSNRLAFLLKAQELGIPTLLAHDEPFSSSEEAWAWLRKSREREGDRAWVLKSVRPLGEGFGVFPVRDLSEQTLGELRLWFTHLSEVTGQSLAFVESHREAARLVDVGLVRDASGLRLAPWIDSSLRFKGRRWLFTCPARESASEIRVREVTATLERMAEALGWMGWGQARFLVEGEEVSLLDWTARMAPQDELASRIAGSSLLEWQLSAHGLSEALADGAGGAVRVESGRGSASFAAGVLVSAENSWNGVPQPGRAEVLPTPDLRREIWEEVPLEVQLRNALREGEELSPLDDGVVSWVMASGANRGSVLEALRVRLADVVFAGTFQTNDAEAQALLAHPWVREDCIHADFLDQDYVPRRAFPMERWAPWVAALDSAVLREGGEIPEAGWVMGEKRIERARLTAPLGSSSVEKSPIHVHSLGNGAYRLRQGSQGFLARPAPPRREPGGQESLPLRSQIRALGGGIVRGYRAGEGSWVAPHEPIVLLESLGRIVKHASGRPVRVLRRLCRPGQRVEAWDLLAEVELLPPESP